VARNTDIDDEGHNFLIRIMDEGMNIKPEDMKQLRQYMRDVPDLWRAAGNIGRLATDRMIEGWNAAPFVKASLEEGARQQRIQHGYKEAAPLERLLIDEIVICWIEHYKAHTTYAGMSGAKLSLNQERYWNKYISQTQGRYLRAIEALARVRKLAQRTPVQINIGGQQVNIVNAGDQAPAGELGQGGR
jgi:hypothetical protein